jgi:GT2 family glycosyltransferase
MRISVILVHFEAQQLMENAILSFWNQEFEADIEFLITDNSSNFNETKFVQLGIPIRKFDLGYNSGFARGVNKGLRNATGDVCVIVNQDAYLSTNNSLETIISELTQLPDKTILGCSLVDEHNGFQQSIWLDDPSFTREWRKGAINCKFNPTWQIKKESIKKQKHQENGFVHRLNGAFLVFKTPKEREEILFDEDFFLYGEDIEWALRIKKHGWKFYYFKDVVVYHIGSASSSNEKIKLAQIEITDWLVIRKLKGKLYLYFYIMLIRFNSWLDDKLAVRSNNEKLIFETKQRRTQFARLRTKYLKTVFKCNSNELFSSLNEYKIAAE